jgi:hypothetical protein
MVGRINVLYPTINARSATKTTTPTKNATSKDRPTLSIRQTSALPKERA